MNTYLILDAAAMGPLIETAKAGGNTAFRSLYMTKEKATDLDSIAPFLFEITPLTNLLPWFQYQPDRWKWGIKVESEADFESLYHHFRKFLLVKTEAGKQLYFRFYDPRVLPDFLNTCNTEQLQFLFGPVSRYLAYKDDGTELALTLINNHQLQVEILTD